MHSKLTLKINGINDSDDLKLIENNLKSQPGIKFAKVTPLFKGYAGIKMEFEDEKITKQQIIEIIKISGDFKIEEQEEIVKDKKDAEPTRTNFQPAAASSVLEQVFAQNYPPRTFFILGVTAIFFVISLILNILFGYLLFKPGTARAQNFGNTTGTAVVQNNPQPQPQPQTPTLAAGPIQSFNITKADNVRGNFNAPITLVEFSDFECPYCAKIYPTLKKILADYPDKVRLVYKYFPLSFHPNAQKASEAAACAGEQGKFWEYHDELFDNQSAGFSLDKFKIWAENLGLNAVQFSKCLDSGKYASQVQAEEAEGQSKGVSGTPATFVNGQLVSGALPYESFKSIIDQLIK